MKHNRYQVIFDFTVSILALIIAVLTIIVLTGDGERVRIFPFIFMAGSLWTGLITAREFRLGRVFVGTCCVPAILVLLFLMFRGLVLYWWTVQL